MNTPVFSLDGTVTEVDLGGVAASSPTPTNEGTGPSLISLSALPDAAFRAPQPTAIFRDRAAEAEQEERFQHRLDMILHPELTTAQDLVQKRELEVQHWTDVCLAQRSEVQRLATLVQRAAHSVMYEDAEPGTRKERLAAAQERFAESCEELKAAKEELTAAQEKVKSLDQVNA